jgi:hypothetical protein
VARSRRVPGRACGRPVGGARARFAAVADDVHVDDPAADAHDAPAAASDHDAAAAHVVSAAAAASPSSSASTATAATATATSASTAAASGPTSSSSATAATTSCASSASAPLLGPESPRATPRSCEAQDQTATLLSRQSPPRPLQATRSRDRPEPGTRHGQTRRLPSQAGRRAPLAACETPPFSSAESSWRGRFLLIALVIASVA